MKRHRKLPDYLLRQGLFMAEIQIKAGNPIIEKGASLTSLCLIIEGEVTLQLPLGEITLTKGDAIGFLDLASGVHSYHYIAKTDVVIDSQPYKHPEHFCESMKNSHEMAQAFLLASLRHINHIWDAYSLIHYECDSLYSALMQYYTDYNRFCKQYDMVPKTLPGFSDVNPLILEKYLESYIGHYYRDMKQIFVDTTLTGLYYMTGFVSGFFLRACNDMHLILDAYDEMSEYMSFLSTFLINEDKLDFLDLYTTLFGVAIQKREDPLALSTAVSKLFIRAKDVSSIDETLYQKRLTEYQQFKQKMEDHAEQREAEMFEQEQTERNRQSIQGSLSQILDFAKVDGTLRARILKNIAHYKNEPDKTADTADLKQLRTDLTADFLELYTKAFLVSMETDSLPLAVKLFFYFGYMDEQLCGHDNTLELIKKSLFLSSRTTENVFLFYDWLTLIYKGEKQPHKDEFDRDYPAYIKSLETDGSITSSVAKLLLDSPEDKVKFEINNMMANGMKMTSGKPASYCPVLSEHNLIKTPSACLLNPSHIMKALDTLLQTDYSAFHREVMFSDVTLGTQHEQIDKQILPRFILLPHIGMRGALWQEIEGFNRQTPASMLLPIFCLTDLDLIILRLTGEFRWEMCKRMQGARWNDVTYPSLTSEYSDYLQFYKKNNALSPEAKQKCHNQLTRVRNRYKECFLIDYMAWIIYESKGAPRLNKVTRQILANYCPFPIEIREELAKNPLYTNILERYQNKKNKEFGRINTVIFKIKRNHRDYCPQALLEQAEFLKK